MLHLSTRCLGLIHLLSVILSSVAASASVTLVSNLDPTISGTYIRGVALDLEDAVSHAVKEMHDTVWLYRQPLEGNPEDGDPTYRWFLSEDILSPYAIAYVDSWSNAETPCRSQEDRHFSSWMVATSDGWRRDDDFDVACSNDEDEEEDDDKHSSLRVKRNKDGEQLFYYHLTDDDYDLLVEQLKILRPGLEL
ncbi:MAG: hypothetical protein SGARI_004473 [Bacillariaceae sp.]